MGDAILQALTSFNTSTLKQEISAKIKIIESHYLLTIDKSFSLMDYLYPYRVFAPSWAAHVLKLHKAKEFFASCRPIAYLVSLEDGQTLPTTENTLSPVETLGSSTTPGGTLPQESHTNLPSSPEQPFTPSHQAHDPKLSEGQPDIDQLGQPPSQPGQTNVQQDEADPHYVSSDHGINYSSGELHLSRSPEDEHADEEDNLLGPAEPSRFEPGVCQSTQQILLSCWLSDHKVHSSIMQSSLAITKCVV